MDLITYLVKDQRIEKEKAYAMIDGGFVKVNGEEIKSNVDVDKKDEIYFPKSLKWVSLDFFDIYFINEKYNLLNKNEDYFSLSPPPDFAFFLYLLGSRLLIPEVYKTKELGKYGNVIGIRDSFFTDKDKILPYSSNFIFSFAFLSPVIIKEQVMKYSRIYGNKGKHYLMLRHKFFSKEHIELKKEFVSIFDEYVYKHLYVSPYSSLAYLIFLKKKS